MRTKISLSLILLLITTVRLLAQPGDPSQDPDVVPLTGIEYLLGLGALWGAKRIYNRSREKNSTSN